MTTCGPARISQERKHNLNLSTKGWGVQISGKILVQYSNMALGPVSRTTRKKKVNFGLGVVAHICNPRTWEVDTEESEF